MSKPTLKAALLCAGLIGLMSSTAVAQVMPEEDEIVVVTGMRMSTSMSVTQGGAQDIGFFRDSVEDDEIPTPASLTSEGLLSEHDMILRRDAPCDQLFCLTVETMAAEFGLKPQTNALMGLGFATNIQSENWDRAPSTIIASVDTSGSMGGEPLSTSKAALHAMVDKLRVGDRFALTHYGSDVETLLPVTEITQDRSALHAAIDELQSYGSTNMESGLELAFALAQQSLEGWDGTTRVALFTDEQPNVGDTHAGSFIAMAREASDAGVGMTTIGVAEHFGADIANEISAARGGNLFFVNGAEKATELFQTEFDLLITEVAHDLKVRIRPEKGVKITEVFGLPGEELKYDRKGGVSFTIPSVFLSSKGGGIFLGLDGDIGASDYARIEMSYLDAATDETGGEVLRASGLSVSPSEGLQTGHLLVEEYQVLREATATVHYGGDVDRAKAELEAFEEKLRATDRDDLEGEIDLVAGISDLLGNYLENIDMADAPEFVSRKQAMADPDLFGPWIIKRVKNTSNSITGKGTIDLRVGDRMAFGLSEVDYDETEIFSARRYSAKHGEPEFESESMTVDADDRTITLWDSDIVFKYRPRKDGRLTVYVEDTDIRMTLVRPEPRDEEKAQG